MKPNPPLVLIEWEDSHHRPGWTTEPAADAPLICRSVGWMVVDSKKVKTLTANLTIEENAQRLGDMTIPTSCIRSIRRLKG